MVFLTFLALASFAVPPTHSLHQDTELFVEKRLQMQQLATAVHECGKLPDVHVPFFAVYGNQVCPNGGAAAAKKITVIVADAHIWAVDTIKTGLGGVGNAVRAIEFQTGAIGFGFQEGSSASRILFFPDQRPINLPNLRPLDGSNGRWFYFVECNDVQDNDTRPGATPGDNGACLSKFLAK